MSDVLQHFRDRIKKFPERGVFYVFIEPGLARPFARRAGAGEASGAQIILKVLGGPYPEDTPLAEMRPCKGGDYAGRVINIEFYETNSRTWRVERDIEIALKIAQALDLQSVLKPGATLADLFNAAARRFFTSTKNPNPPRLLFTLEHKKGTDGNTYATVVDVAVAPPKEEGE